MEALVITIPVSLFIVIFFVACFIWAAKKGEFTEIESKKNIIFEKVNNTDMFRIKKGIDHESKK